MIFRSFLIVTMGYLLSGCSAFGVRSEYEQPRFVVVEKLTPKIEVRRYADRLAVETTVDIPDYHQSRNAAFRVLFDYISGNNRTGDGAVSDSPVAVAMTTPVETGRAETGAMRMRFFLPAQFTQETAPKPLDYRVRLVKVTSQLQAVLRFSGFASEETVAKRTKELLGLLGQSSWNAVSEPVAYFYDPPWAVPFLRRNEIGIAVAPISP